MSKFITLMSIIVLLTMFSTTSATIINVPADSSTIQAALNACATGDTVLIATGTYTLTNYITWPNTADIKLLSVGDASNTIIDANGNYHIFYIDGAGVTIDSNTIIDGFTITGGNANGPNPHNYGGGFYCSFASPTISNNIITNNLSNYGSGFYCCSSSSPIINNNKIINNSADYYGGGISCAASSPTISDNTIINNSAANYGGGIYLNNASPTINDNTIINNSAANYGGGICFAYYSSPTISNNTITNNLAGEGGGIYRSDSNSNPILGGSSTTTNNIYHNSPDNFYNNDVSSVEATHNYWGNFTSSEIYQTFAGTGAGNIDYDTLATEPVEVKQYTHTISDTLYFAELILSIDGLTGEDTIRVNTHIDTLPIGVSSGFLNKFWNIALDNNISSLDGDLTFYYDTSEVALNMEDSLLSAVRWDGIDFYYYDGILDTANNCFICTPPAYDHWEGDWLLSTSAFDFPAISNLQAIAKLDMVSLSWDRPVKNKAIDYYYIYRGNSPANYTLIDSTTAITYDDIDVINFNTYYYAIKTIYNYPIGISAYSNEANATPYNFATPNNLQASGGVDVIDLTWETPDYAKSKGLENYKIYRSEISGESYVLLDSTITDTNYIDNDVTNFITYYYVVSAVYTNPDSESIYGNEANAISYDFAVPTNLQASGGVDVIDLVWETPDYAKSKGLENYKIYRSETSGEGYILLDSTITDTNYVDNTTTNFITYYYVVSAVYINPAGESTYSNEASAISYDFAIPINLQAVGGVDVIDLVWETPDYAKNKGLENYKIYRSETSGEGYILLDSTITDTNYVDNTISYDITYYYVVSAVYTNPNGESVYSNEASAMVETGIRELEIIPIPDVYNLSQNYPNPFNPSTVIKYQLPISSNAQLNIYNVKGQLVKTLVNETQNSGYYNITWDGKDNDNREVASGLYVYRIIAGDYTKTKRMLLLKQID